MSARLPLRRAAAVAATASLLGACAPQVAVHQPTTLRPAPATPVVEGDGAIFQAASFRPLLEDRRARYPGDTLVVIVNEKISASQKSGTSASRTGSATLDVPKVSVPGFAGVRALEVLPGRLQGTHVEGKGSQGHDGKGETSSSNLVTGTITVTVMEVLANGNLLVSGEKQIGVNREKETVRFSGVVSPAFIMAGNVVSSSQVADARFDYIGEGAIDSALGMGWLGRFFMSFFPF